MASPERNRLSQDVELNNKIHAIFERHSSDGVMDR